LFFNNKQPLRGGGYFKGGGFAAHKNILDNTNKIITGLAGGRAHKQD